MDPKTAPLLEDTLSSFDPADTALQNTTDNPMKKNATKRILIIVLVVFFSLCVVAAIVTIILVTGRGVSQTDGETEKSTLHFLYLNDLHIDPKYEEYSANGSCRTKSESVTIPKPFGQYSCDTPPKTFTSLLNFVKKTYPQLDFILFGGDTVAHKLGLSTEELRAEMQNVVNKLEEKYPNTPIFITIGNNDFTQNYGTPETDPVDFDNVLQVFGKYMTDSAKETYRKGGYYLHDFPDHSLRLIMMNTVLYSKAKRQFNASAPDPYGQFAWLEQACTEAEKLNLKVGLTMHIPPGVSFYDYAQGWYDEYITQLYNIISKHDIEFSIAGHTHVDLLMPLFSDEHAQKINLLRQKKHRQMFGLIDDNNLTMLDYTLSAPSVTPNHKNNPGFRIFHIENGRIKDYDQYYADIMLNPQTELNWQKEYSFTNVYGGNLISMEQINEAVNWIRTTGEGSWRYREFTYTRAEEHLSFFLCILKSMTTEAAQKCVSEVNPLSISPYGNDFD